MAPRAPRYPQVKSSQAVRKIHQRPQGNAKVERAANQIVRDQQKGKRGELEKP